MTRSPMWIAASALALAAASGMALAQDVAREDTVIFDLDRTIKGPENFNWFTPGSKRIHGAHQTMWEPLFILNYATGNIDPWLATGFEANDGSTEFTISLRDGAECQRWHVRGYFGPKPQCHRLVRGLPLRRC